MTTRHERIQGRVAALAGTQRRTTAQAVAELDTAAGAEQGRSAELWLYGVVGGFFWGFDSEDVAHTLRSFGDDVTSITVRLDSPGGIATQGIAIANLLANHPANVTVVVDGLAASAASQIALAGDAVVMSPGAQMMLHDASVLTYGNAAQLRSDADFVDKQSANYAETYAHRAGGTAEQWREVMLADGGRGTWYTAAEAVDAGLADRVGNIASVTPPPAEPAIDEGDEEAAARAALDLDALVHPSVRASWSDRLSARTRSPQTPTASADGNHNTRGGTMSFNDDVRTRLGVTEDADEATILAALDEALAENADPEPETNSAPEVPEGMTLIETEVLDGLRDGARQGIEARQQQLTEERDRAIEAAISSGRTTPARREHWQAAWDADPEGARAQLEALAPGLVPVTEVGEATNTEESAEDAIYARLYPTEKEA
jgi:ATP-dependent protease ClpP protease subunit